VFCFLGVAFAYALLNAPLVAIIQILVYVGAISIVIIFAIMLTEVQTGGMELFFKFHLQWSVASGCERWNARQGQT
jgi:NADH-quinone oxidoreductase subunit J